MDVFEDSPDEDDRLNNDELLEHLKRRWAGQGDLYLGEIDAEPIEIALPPLPPAPKESGLVLRGNVSSVRMMEETGLKASFTATLDLEFENSGDRPVILLRPGAEQRYLDGDGEEYWINGEFVSDSRESMRLGNYVYSRWHGLSNSRSLAGWGRMRSDLDQPQPSALLFWVIPPGQTRTYVTNVFLSFARKPDNSDSNKSWTEISRFSPLWLRVNLEIWPFNMEPNGSADNPEFGRRLRQKWTSAGTLALGRSSAITSEPMELVLPGRAQSAAPK